MQDNYQNVFLRSTQPQNGQYITPSREWEIESAPKPITTLRAIKGVSRLGLLVSLSLTATLAVRVFPVFIPSYCIGLAVSAAAAAIYGTMARSTQTRMLVLIVGLCVLAGCIGGSWDAVYAVMTDTSGQRLGLQVGVVICSLVGAFVAERIFRGAKD